ncbi:MAG TPA: chitobiase/beta-hexosaminidase C-terminal domain-containing protein [Acidobacteriaceae bacterium]|jgi:hypothetical protein|nr:chitobiase/beta-hexosaminidase C-terminal domain-containing protein [Acidobacteriaceae bacterium]
MRLSFILFLVLCGTVVYAQDDAAMQASQMAAQASEMATQQAIQNSQMATQQAMQDSQIANQQAMQAAQNSANAWSGLPMASTPKFSMKPGSYSSAVTLRMKDKTRGAILYYTTDDWTPTPQSTRYVGPITITSTTHLQAIAVAPGYMRSQIAAASYTLPAAPASEETQSPSQSASTPTTVAPGKIMLLKGTRVPLMITADVKSKALAVGDKIPMALAQNLMVGSVVVAEKGTPALATVTQVDAKGFAGQPGTITFAVHSLDAPGNEIGLYGTETKEGQNSYKTVRSVSLVPFVGISAIFVHGKEAEIQLDTPLTAFVSADTPVRPEE